MLKHAEYPHKSLQSADSGMMLWSWRFGHLEMPQQDGKRLLVGCVVLPSGEVADVTGCLQRSHELRNELEYAQERGPMRGMA